MLSRLSNSIAVLIGGALGAVSRFEFDAFLSNAVLRPGFPYGILIINVLGGFLMGLLQGRIKRSGRPFALLYSLLGAGFLGAFTTVSTFSLQTFTLYQSGHVRAAALNVLCSVIFAVGAAAVGYHLAGGASAPGDSDERQSAEQQP